MKLTATVVGLQGTEPLFNFGLYRAAVSFGLNTKLHRIRKDINNSVREHFTTKVNPNQYATVVRSTRDTLFAEIRYDYAPHSLALFDTKQIRVTTGSRKLSVRSTRRAGVFAQRIVNPQTAVKTLVKVKRGSPYKLVHGKLGYMGWLHSGHNKIFERDQQTTWSNGKRLPFHALWGLSISQQVNHPLVQADILAAHYEDMITFEALRELQL